MYVVNDNGRIRNIIDSFCIGYDVDDVDVAYNKDRHI